MKTLLFSLLFYLAFAANAQDFSGDYTSSYTTFTDEQNPDNNFKETTTFNVAVIFENKNSGYVAIQDPRIPKKILIYKVEQFLDKLERDGASYYFYQAVSEHTKEPIETKVVIYIEKDGELNLMVLWEGKSQIFHGVKKRAQ